MSDSERQHAEKQPGRRRRGRRRRRSHDRSRQTDQQSAGPEANSAAATGASDPTTPVAAGSAGSSGAPGDGNSGTRDGRPPAGSGRRRSRRRRRGHGKKTNATKAVQNPPSTSESSSVGRQKTQPEKPSTRTGDTAERASGRRRDPGARNRKSGRRTRPGGPPRAHVQRPRMQTNDETSAGGLVVSGLAESVREDGSVDLGRIYVALIGRLDRRGRLLWSMPKGHVEPGEGRAATAEREVWEETGISGEVFAELGVIDYWFVSEGVRIHKTVHHHLLRYLDGDLNDEDPEVTEVTWVPASELIERLAYADERKLARCAHDMLPELARREKSEGRRTPR
ncbi:NUDIX hydrolase [Corynebacterium sp. CCM 9185]|uniref:NUDIX hydrolase n=1 Tax=Corynebacterium marambiense TaxID=2765364 RepID=A0ABS0VST5_9CORY|nr:NUDIX hydrolase [Corynebacterium marambiense]MBI8999827.1 NUDIX hydrolase [Corynebacterium marambiense]MCK7662666.1 NUDIX hydrolase [Corynebacterium marambiense]